MVGAPKRPAVSPRAALVKKMRRALDVHGEVPDIDAALDVVLEAFDDFARPRLENDWSGGEVLHQLRVWRVRHG